MGFTSGFTGGVTLTLGIAYLTILAHQRNRQQQSASLRATTALISGITDPLPPVPPPTRAELAAAERANLVETAKDRWNAEVEGAVRWVQNKDWEEVRENLESATSRLWVKAFNQAGEGVDKAEKEGAKLAGDAKGAASYAAGRVHGAAVEASGSVAAQARSAYAGAKTAGVDAAGRAEQKAEQAKGSVLGAISRGIEKGKEALGVARATAAGAEQRVEATVNEALSPVERAMRQRYEQPKEVKKTAEQVLAERYQPMDKRDGTVLRGL